MPSPTLVEQLSHYVLDGFWQLGNCFNCFPKTPSLKINGRSFKILRLLGEGGFSYVYLVQSPGDPTLYALKKIRCPFGQESVAQALKEVEAYSLFAPHPNIIHALDHSVESERGDPSNKTVYILLPYYRRGNLQDAINANLVNRARFPERRLMVLFLGVCRALKAMHQYRVKGAPGGEASRKKAKKVRPDAEAEEGTVHANQSRRRSQRGDDDDDDAQAPLMDGEVMAAQEGVAEGGMRSYAHRDIKPGNIMISDTGTQPILMDLGSLAPSPTPITSRALALQVQDQAAEHSTMPYRAPELFDVKTGSVIDTKVDIWSLGCTLYACLVGKSPFEARSEETGGSLSLCVLGGDWRFPDEGPAEAKRGKQRVSDVGTAGPREDSISEGVKEVVRKCLVVEAEHRPDIDQVISMVEEVVAALPSGDDGEAARMPTLTLTPTPTFPFAFAIPFAAPHRRPNGVPNAPGTHVLYTVSSYSFETHSKSTELRVLSVESGESQALGKDDDISDLNWLHDATFACLQAEKDGTTSLRIASVPAAVPEPKLRQSHSYIAGNIPAPASNLKLKQLDEHNYAVVVSAPVSPDAAFYNPEKAAKTHSTAKLYSSLYVRHWDKWSTKEKNALWYGQISRKSHRAKFTLSHLSNAIPEGLECPIQPFGGTDHFDLSKNAIIFVSKDPHVNPALNTTENVYIVQVGDWASKKTSLLQQVIVPGFQGAASSPVFSQDGTKAAFLMMKTRGYEADKNHIWVIPDLSGPNLTPLRAFAETEMGDWDRSPASIVWSCDGRHLLATAEEYGTGKLFQISGDLARQEPRILTHRGYIADVRPLPDGRIFVTGSSLSDNSFYAIVDPLIAPHPGRPHTDALLAWTHSNSQDGRKFGLNPGQISSIWTPASNPRINEEVHSIVVYPSNYDRTQTYPVAYLIHGGPQGAWGDSWSTRWNPAVFAEQGYIVIAINPTGSTGYGQAFTDAIRRNWGGDPYQDIVNVFDWAKANIPEADHNRAVALGASYGGYMMNWIQGHDLGRQFKALVCHDGITSFTGGMLATEELYFPFYDLGGTPWYDPGFKPAPGEPESAAAAAQSHANFGASSTSAWRQWDPSEHFANWSTPQLVIHSSKDYRLTIAEGLTAFNVLQARGVESKFLTFPDENHWVLKPENSLVWHKVVLNWINHYAGLPPYAEEDENSDEFFGGLRESEEIVEMEGSGMVST
ncbi:hypothetical protein AC579_2341 [Pseudocercospora musae]|uniref:non-specific serine/threonine protein kinase n=1 Tax=Pseudocercospora musae TaxID=113226 RepID=A0A139IGI6_9PEZI|nr:hypothetical protein AC579_2341 [Pseudocercospora musae]